MKREMMNMTNPSVRSLSVCVAMLAMWVSSGAYAAPGEPSEQPAYASPAEAAQKLFQALQSNNEQAITKILGGPSDLTSSANGDQDKVDRELFVQKYQEMHRLHRDPDGSVTLYIGAENWPFPIPLFAKNGAWQFDPEAGAKEVLFRRIGDNELTAIATCREFVAAKQRYASNPNPADPTESSPASLVAKAARSSGGGAPVLLHGYYFRVLPKGTDTQKNGKVSVIAYPAEYRSSGVMTFVVMGNGVVYEKDLGTNTFALAAAMDSFHKDASWHAAGE